ncbi:MAG: ABC transporter permease [Proteobacteria bacterium]|nr:ABC transporter permease [Pseudomonadota bacterium]
MTGFLLRRLVGLAGTLAAASLVVFVVLEILPGDPARAILGVDAEAAAVLALRSELGLDSPAPVRYVRWVGGMLRGDFGTSWTYRIPVVDLVLPRLAVTVPLAVIAMLLSVTVAIALGLVAARHHGHGGDLGVMAFSQAGIAMPNFWLGLLLILLFAVSLGWFPSGGFPGWRDGVGAALWALVLPAISLATVQAAILARIVRAAVLEVSRDDFVRTARAKGLSRRRTLLHHVLRNAMLPTTTVMGMQFSFLMAGTVVIESVFFLPGLGRLALQAIANRDLVVVEAVVLLLAAMVIVVNLIVDLVHRSIDPRLGESR